MKWGRWYADMDGTQGRNVALNHEGLLRTEGTFSVSGRPLRSDMDVVEYLRTYYYFLDLKQIDSVFGTHPFPSKLYGGWGYQKEYSIQDKHIDTLQTMGIGVALTTTNHFFEEEGYRESWPMLERLHSAGNSLIITSDDLARQIRKDFPAYQLRASITKNLDTHEKIARALELYDQVLVPMDKNDDDNFLNAIQEKERIILFANAGCAYNCPARTCYHGNSQSILGREVTSICSKNTIPRPDLGYVVFDTQKLSALGFFRFKLIPPRTAKLDVALKKKGWR